ncbi:MAG: hypothetical protein Q3995_05180 [Eubacteriales bacterium]|nr:hypothetical protein [Eubacteriales bacterium]
MCNNNGFGGNCCLWILIVIIILFGCGGCGGCGNWGNGCGNNNCGC